jgi:LAS superfamily LD-carboxypeptidase LdcB
MTNAEHLARIHPVARKHFEAFLAEAKQAGYGRLNITESLRTKERQAELYGQGRTKEQLARVKIDPKYAKPNLPVVTKVTPGFSMHNIGLAIDLYIQAYPHYETTNGKKIDHWQRIGNIAKKHGIVWGGTWKMYDAMHFEYTGGLTQKQIFVEGKRPTR